MEKGAIDMTYPTKIKGFTIRDANADDAALLLELIHGLADYEQMSDDVHTDAETLGRNIFEKGQANVIIGEEEGVPVCFALYFYNFSTFEGRHGLYLEDLFVKTDYRGKGYGTAMLAWLAKKAVDEDCARFEWVCLDWNEPALNVYRRLGAQPQNQWVIQRLTGQELADLADSF